MPVKPLEYLHKKILFRVDDNVIQRLKKSNPEVYERLVTETKRFIEHYGVPSPGGAFGGLWDDDCPRYVNDLLSQSDRIGRPLRITVEPEAFDEDAHHWTVSYEWLEWDAKKGWISLSEVKKDQ